jgi:transposase-like protein
MTGIFGNFIFLLEVFIMVESEKQKRFIELRSQSISYLKISKEIGVSKNTLVKWSKELSNELKNAKSLEMEAIREEYFLTRRHRLRIIGSQLSKLTQEILNRDLSEVPTWRLFEMQQKLTIEVEKDNDDVKFYKNRDMSPSGMMTDILTKTENWTG